MNIEKYAMIIMTDRTGLVDGLPISLFIEELNKLPKNAILKSFTTQIHYDRLKKTLSFTYTE